MLKGFKTLIAIQELDIKMIRLMRVKRQRQGELKQIESLRTELKEQLKLKEEEIKVIETQVNGLEKIIQTLTDKYKKLESQQSNVKKVEEFNALTQEMTTIEREKVARENETSNILDQKVAEEEVLEKIKASLGTSETNSMELEKEIKASIDQINIEGQKFKRQREEIFVNVDRNALKVYERLLRNKKDRVIVPIENRTCSGCHITLTLQHENLVRKGDAMVFCEHCSRIHYWEEQEIFEGEATQPRRRRRRTAKA